MSGRHRKLCLLMASSSMAALLIGGGTPRALAACANTINASFDNPLAATTPCVAVTNTSFTGNITNEGTISPGGITFTNGTITGFISDSGVIAGGIVLDNTSAITAAGVAILITGPTFLGGISNAGTLSGGAFGIGLNGVTTFAAGITNTGTIAGGVFGINIQAVATLTGGISNAGLIANATKDAIGATGVSVFSGGITNSGTLSANHAGIEIDNIATFQGGIVNSRSISAGSNGIEAGAAVGTITTFAGGIINTGNITAGANGVVVGGIGTVSTFAGGISNAGNITAAAKGILVGGVSTFATFAGGIGNSGQITAGTTGIDVTRVVVFGSASPGGGIVNGGTITAGAGNAEINVFNTSTFLGGISNSGTLTGGALAVDVNGVGTFAGGITNTGSIADLVGGILVQTVATFAGGISNAGSIANGSKSAIGITRVSVFSGGITNSGTLSANGPGIEIDAIATFQGGIVNSQSILAGSNGIQVGALPGTITTFAGGIANSGNIVAGADGILVGNASTVLAFSGGISNAGAISAGQTGIHVDSVSSFAGGISNSGTISALNGIVVASGVSFAGGGAIVNSGTILGGTAAIDVTAATSPVTIDQTGGLISGAIKLSTNADVLNVTGGAIAGNVVGAGAADTVNFALGSGTFTYAVPWAMTGLGQVNFNSGTAFVDGSIQAAAIAVNNGGTAGGTGTLVGPVTVFSGGTLMPGDSTVPLVSLHVSGSLTFNPGSFYAVRIAPGSGNNSAAAVIGAPGTLTINGGTVLVTPQLGHYNTAVYQIGFASGSVSGTFSGLTFGGPLGFSGTASLSYDVNDVFLNLGSGFAIFAVPGANQNQQNVINGINNFITSGGALPTQFQNLANLSNPALLNALTQLSGENNAGVFQGAFQAGNSFLGLMINPFLDGRVGNGGGFGAAMGFAAEEPPVLPEAAAAYASVMPVKARPAPPTFAQRFSVWGAAYGGSGRVTGDAVVGSHDTSASAGAFAAGIDYRISPDTLFGVALAGGGTGWNLTGGLGGGHSDMFQAGVYGSHHWGAAYLSGAVAYNFHDVTTDRTVTVAGIDKLEARFQANGVGTRLEGGYRYATPWLGITPYAAAQVQSIALPNYSESASVGSNQFALNFASQTATTERTELGFWLDRSTRLDNDALLTLYGRAAWAHDFGNNPHAGAIFQALPGSNFIVNGAVPARDGALVTGAAQYSLASGWSFLAKFDGEFSSTTSIYSGSGMIKKVW